MSGPVAPTPGDLGFSYELQIDIDTAFPSTPAAWAQLGFITNVDPSNAKTFSDSSTYFNKGAKAQTISGEDWTLTFDHQVQRVTATGAYITNLQKLVDAAAFGNRNDAAKVHVRFYDTEGADYAYEGEAYVAMQRTNRGNNDVAAYTFTLTGDGALTSITNPVTP